MLFAYSSTFKKQLFLGTKHSDIESIQKYAKQYCSPEDTEQLSSMASYLLSRGNDDFIAING